MKKIQWEIKGLRINGRLPLKMWKPGDARSEGMEAIFDTRKRAEAALAQAQAQYPNDTWAITECEVEYISL